MLSVAVSGTAVPTETTSYTYDAIGQLLTETKSTGFAATYTYDANGNRLSKSVTGGTSETYSYDWGDKLLDVKVNGSAIKTFAYDNYGRTTGITASGATTIFSWNDTSRLTSIDLPGTAPDPSYAYNPAGTRVSRSLAGNTTTWKRAGAGVTAPVLNDGAASYVPGISERRGSTTTYSHSGIKNEVAQSSLGSVSASRSYDAFGAVLSSSGAWQGSHGYAGGFGYQEDAESGLKLLGHRYYDSSTGRFLSRDPIKDGRNWYAYCEGNPVSLADPDGNIPILVVIGIILIVAEIVDAASDVKDIYDNPSDPVPYISLMLGAIDPSPGNIGKRFAKGGLRIAKESMRHADDVVDVGKRLPVLNPNRPARMGMETPDRSWTTSRRNHWKMRAREDGASDYYGEANVERMKKGLAPKNQAGKSMELDHYPVPRRDGGKEFIERWPEEHALHDPFRHL